MTQHITHVCPNCGRRIKCDRPLRSTRDFEAESPVGTATLWPTIEYQTYWGISKIADSLLKTLAFWIPANVAVITATVHYRWPESIPGLFSVVSLVGFLRLFGKVPSWHNEVQTEPPAQPAEPAPEPEDKRRFVGWVSESHTRTTQRVEWYHSPVPIPQARSFALALVNNHFEWVDERDLSTHKANISGPNYRKLRRDWVDREWASEMGKRTVVVNRTMIRRIAFESPE